MIRRLAAIDEATRLTQSKVAADLLCSTDVFSSARSVMVFLSMPGEIDTTPVIQKVLQSDKRLCAPRVRWAERLMDVIEVSDVDKELLRSSRGYAEPSGKLIVEKSSIDLVLVPGLAFDTWGRRLGRGMGFYDRFLTGIAIVSCGYAFDEQVVSIVPADDHDVLMSMLVTPERVRHF